ncbi:MAG TPA: hypothetical protein VG474_15115 [Solirubrobacteraceae bacterium]|nr:hypothetical protein [Solirubrobacteraceae bacterium]
MQTTHTQQTAYETNRALVSAWRQDIQQTFDARLAQGFSPAEALRSVAQPLRAANRARVLRDSCLLETTSWTR